MTLMQPFAVWLGPRTIGYSFAYFAFVRLQHRGAANHGATFFYMFGSINDALSDEEQR